MIGNRWKVSAAIGLVCLLPACTLFPQYELEEPLAEVTLNGDLNVSAVSGRTIYWGQVRNTGDVDVEEVRFVVDVYGGGGAFLGRFSAIVSKGVEEEDPITTLAAGQYGPGSGEVGDFIVHTSVPWGAAARADYLVEFTEVLPEVDVQ